MVDVRTHIVRLFAALAAVLALELAMSGCSGPGSYAQARGRVMRTAALGSAKDMELILNAYPSLANHKDAEGATPLHNAALNGNVGAIEVLIKHHADANAADKGRETPLMEAAAAGKVDAVRRLLSAGAKPDASRGQEGPLHLAVMMGHLETVRLLIAAGADVNAPGSSDGRMTPLFLAKCRKANAIEACLRKHGAKSLRVLP